MSLFRRFTKKIRACSLVEQAVKLKGTFPAVARNSHISHSGTARRGEIHILRHKTHYTSPPSVLQDIASRTTRTVLKQCIISLHITFAYASRHACTRTSVQHTTICMRVYRILYVFDYQTSCYSIDLDKIRLRSVYHQRKPRQNKASKKYYRAHNVFVITDPC